jgi:hypothetical protein
VTVGVAIAVLVGVWEFGKNMGTNASIVCLQLGWEVPVDKPEKI